MLIIAEACIICKKKKIFSCIFLSAPNAVKKAWKPADWDSAVLFDNQAIMPLPVQPLSFWITFDGANSD